MLALINIELTPGKCVQFEYVVDRLSAADLKVFARPYLGKAVYPLKKLDLLKALKAVLTRPDALEGLASGQGPFGKVALRLLRASGGSMPEEVLAGALWVCGHPYRGGSDRSFSSAPVNSLPEAGLTLEAYAPARTASRSAQQPRLVFSDPRLLNSVHAATPAPLPCEPIEVTSPQPAFAAAGVALALCDRIARVGRESGAPRPKQRRPASSTAGDDEARTRLLDMVISQGALMPERSRQAALAAIASAAFQAPYELQALDWLRAYQWDASGSEGGIRIDYDVDYALRLRLELPRPFMAGAMMMALASLPKPDGWYAVASFSEALIARLSPLIPQRSGAGFGMQEAPERRVAREALNREARESAQNALAGWISASLTGPLRLFGFVQPGKCSTGPAFRLTSTGYATWYALRGERIPVPATPPPRWLVQPNLEVMAYLDGLGPSEVVFLTRVGELTGAIGAITVFRLTRESIYFGLESGLTIEEIVSGLAAHAEHPMADSVVRTLRDWGGRRERISLTSGVQVLEFPSAAARAGAVKRWKLQGREIGDRLFRLEIGSSPPDSEVATTLDYSRPCPPCLQASEEGAVQATAPTDLTIRGLLERWAEPAGPGLWRLTETSVRRGGGDMSILIAQLAARLPSRRCPELLELALNAWSAGTPRTGVSLSPATLLLIEDPDLQLVVARSPLLRGYLVGQLSDEAYLVDPSKVEELRSRMREMGIQDTDQLRAPPLYPIATEEISRHFQQHRRRRR